MDTPGGNYANEVKSDKERQIACDFTYMCNLKNIINEQTKQRQTHRYREQIDGCQMGEGLGIA